MADKIHRHLKRTYRMISQAYPKGIPEKDYFPLLAMLYDQMSDRNLAEVVSSCCNQDYFEVWNDIAKVVTTHIPAPEEIDRIRRKLLPFGLEQALQE